MGKNRYYDPYENEWDDDFDFEHESKLKERREMKRRKKEFQDHRFDPDDE